MADLIDIPKNARETLRIQREEYQGHDLVNVRIWVSDDSGELRPTRKGLAIQASLTPSLIEALAKVSASDAEAA
ncbi:MAG: transcriptional coactivator p15/PC4 family protein [Pseudomonadota bacterium]